MASLVPIMAMVLKYRYLSRIVGGYLACVLKLDSALLSQVTRHQTPSEAVGRWLPGNKWLGKRLSDIARPGSHPKS